MSKVFEIDESRGSLLQGNAIQIDKGTVIITGMGRISRMNLNQKQQLESLNDALVLLQNRCNRAQGALLRAEREVDEELVDRLLNEASLELVESVK